MTSWRDPFIPQQSFNETIVTALIRRIPILDIIRARDVGLARGQDPELLAWAAQQGRLLMTHDRKTMPGFAAQRIRAGQCMSGLIVVGANDPIGRVVADLQLVAECSESQEWEDQIVYLPL